jgi:hypothetical protein
MIRSQWVTLVVFAALAVPVLAQKTGCFMVTQQEAAVILGKPVETQAFASSCIYKVKGSTTVSLVAKTHKNNPTAVNSVKANFAKTGGVVKDEPGIGPGAFSAVRPDSLRIYVFKGDQELLIDYVDTAKAKWPTGLMERMKAAAKAGLDRL